MTSETSAPVRARVAAFIPTLLRAIRATRLYPADSSARRQYVDPAYLELFGILYEHGAIVLRIADGIVFHQGEVVYASTERDLFAPVLWASSIFELSFQPGMEREELTQLIDALTSEEAAHRVPGESLVTVLWRLGLPHVKHRHFELMRMLARPEDTAALPTDWIEDDEAKRLRARIGRVADRLGSDGEGEKSTRMSGVIAGTRESPLRTARICLECVKPGAVLRVHGELSRVDTREVLSHRLAVLLIRALAVDPDASASSAPAEMLARLLEEMVESARFEGAARVLTFFRSHAKSTSMRPVAGALRERLARAAGVRRAFEALARTPAAERSATMLKLGVYLRALGPALLEALLGEAQAIDDPALLEIIAGVLIDISGSDTTPIAERLSLLSAELALKLLAAARVFDDEGLSAIVRAGIGHPSAKVRMQALSALSGIQLPWADVLIASAIHDADTSVRKAALRLAATNRVGAAVREILELLRAKDLERRDMRELRLMFDTLVSLDGLASMSVLERHVFLRGGLRFSANETQIAAALALSRIDDPKAQQLLEKGARSWSLDVRAACRRALEPRQIEPLPPPAATAAPVVAPVVDSEAPTELDLPKRELQILHIGKKARGDR